MLQYSTDRPIQKYYSRQSLPQTYVVAIDLTQEVDKLYETIPSICQLNKFLTRNRFLSCN